MSILTNNKLLAAFLILLIGGAAWWGLTNGTSTPLLDSSTGPKEDQSFITTLLTLNSISLTGTIFKDPAFASLKDFGVDIITEPSGRPNPFAPLSAIAPATGTSTPSIGTLPTRVPTPPARR
jgi:hypothetical protein